MGPRLLDGFPSPEDNAKPWHGPVACAAEYNVLARCAFVARRRQRGVADRTLAYIVLLCTIQTTQHPLISRSKRDESRTDVFPPRCAPKLLEVRMAEVAFLPRRRAPQLAQRALILRRGGGRLVGRCAARQRMQHAGRLKAARAQLVPAVARDRRRRRRGRRGGRGGRGGCGGERGQRARARGERLTVRVCARRVRERVEH
ncbi:hypothetical protein DFH11DRAFT_288185 [Phellopilus nigrolimitatus]|nr:hypothetical protein DFH11DRAFT_288185 [Phellopilus nigrolimitatus]